MSEAVRSPAERLGPLVINALARLGDPEGVRAAEAMLRDPDTETRARQVRFVVELHRKLGRDVLPLLLEALGDKRGEVRLAALETAQLAPDPRLVPTVASLLGDRADEVRYQARRFLKTAACQQAEPLQAVLDLILDASSEVSERIGAMQALMYAHRMEAVAEVLHRAMEDPHPAVRLWAGKALTSFEDRTATAVRLVASLRESPAREMQLSQLWALARLGVPEGREHLVPAAQSPDPEVAAPGIYGLGLACDPRDLPLLRNLRDRNPA